MKASFCGGGQWVRESLGLVGGGINPNGDAKCEKALKITLRLVDT